MAHEIEQMAYVGETPWHGLGNILTPGQSIETWQREAGLNWTVRESPVYFYIDNELTRIREAATRKVLWRDDTEEPLSVVSKIYKPVQPRDVLEFYRDLVADFGFTIETAGSLKGGLKIWALAKTGDSAFLASQDEVRSYLLLATSYDATFATTAQFTTVRVLCNNTLDQSLKNRESGAIKIGHREDFNPTAVKDSLGLSRERFGAWMAAAERLTQLQLSSLEASQLYATALGIPEDPALGDKHDRKLAAIWAQTYANQTYKGPSNTAWGAVNVVTEYLDHIRRQSTPGGRLHSAWFGPGNAMKNAVWDAALELV